MAQHNVSVEDTLKVLVENKKYSTVKDVLVTMNPSDIASIFDELAEDQLPIMFRLLPKALAADTFVEMDPDNQEYRRHYASIVNQGQAYQNQAQGHGYNSMGNDDMCCQALQCYICADCCCDCI